MVLGSLAALGAAEGIKMAKNYWEKNKHDVAKKAHEFICSKYGGSGNPYVHSACEFTKSFVANPGPTLMDKPVKPAKKNIPSFSGTAGSAQDMEDPGMGKKNVETGKKKKKKSIKKLRKAKHTMDG